MLGTRIRKSATTRVVALGGGLIVAATLVGAAPAVDQATVRPVDCWSDRDSDQSLCVPTGTGIEDAVFEQFGVEILIEVAPGELESTVTGRTYDAEEVFAANAARGDGSTAARRSVTLISLYTDADFHGSLWYITAGSGCASGPLYLSDYGAQSPGSGYFNNRVSSMSQYSDCATTFYDNASLGGADSGLLTWPSGNLVGFNDRANSSWTEFG